MTTHAEPGPALGLPDHAVFALTLHHEASGEGRRGMVAVGCLIRNRVAWGRWGATVRAVCLAPWQFSCWRKEGGASNYGALVLHADALRRGGQPARLAEAFDVVGEIERGIADPTGGADHYYAPAAMVPPGRVPPWAANVAPTAVIGRHRFYRLRVTG